MTRLDPSRGRLRGGEPPLRQAPAALIGARRPGEAKPTPILSARRGREDGGSIGGPQVAAGPADAHIQSAGIIAEARAPRPDAGPETRLGEAEEDQPGAFTEDPAVTGRYQSDGTSYVMYADGSIDARSERGVFHFKSMADLKAFLQTQG